ncbi:sulfatase [Singulisphaera acidiphila]|uniref:Arylsulfatase A family protein n=1 Tax=Singulisphaera acidiphila (strain ATCC BAA-1392 / DSM 18658 / VKM B-2454 / MOB10) TaxID=886293 RepID=L0DDY4_SINAD|nr:sulfatase [Singulisphaera acidiphila]AGA27452.1 arylsulfatase A family protein [Singulisphaera acidiphila DSM 18658]
MAERTNRASVPGKTRDAADDHSQPVEATLSSSSDSKLFRPTSALRKILGRGTTHIERESSASAPAPAPLANRLPGALPLAGTTLAVGVAAGFLELALVFGQFHGLHQVRWSSLMISRHAAWMIPVAETLLVAAWTLVLVAPVLGVAAWLRAKGQGKRSIGLTWNWAGMVLGTFLLLGPLLTLPGLHPVAVVILALGLGYRIRGWLVRPTTAWKRGACWAGGLVFVMLPVYSFVQERRVTAAPERAWSRPAPAAAAGVGAPNLLWIVMDTVRADHLSLYGYGRQTTPELEALAKEGITFDMARSAAPWTLPSHMTMFTGLWPYQHGARVDRPYYGPSPMLAEHLSAHGYTTAGIVANVRVCNAGYGFGRGFDSYVDYPRNQTINLNETVCNSTLGEFTMNLVRRARLPVPGVSPFFVHRPASVIISDAQQWLDRVQNRNQVASDTPRPFFLFLNFMDVHGPYLPSPSSDRKFWSGPVPEQSLASPNGGWLAVRALNSATPDQRPQKQQELNSVTQRLIDLYDECLHGLDAELGRFLRDLRATGKLDNTWVVITGDHGEHLGEHGHFGHGSSLYSELTHVPLLLIPPLNASGTGRESTAPLRDRRIGVPVAHRDLPRTFGDLLLPKVKNPFPGRSLARHWNSSDPQRPDPILSQLEKQPLDGQEVDTERVVTMDSVIDEDHVLIENSINTPELYQLFQDPKQDRNLAGQAAESPRQARLKRTLESLLRIPAAAAP